LRFIGLQLFSQKRKKSLTTLVYLCTKDLTIIDRKERMEMKTRMDWPKEVKMKMRACAQHYRKSGYDWQLVEAKVRRNWLPNHAEYILHLYYNR